MDIRLIEARRAYTTLHTGYHIYVLESIDRTQLGRKRRNRRIGDKEERIGIVKKITQVSKKDILDRIGQHLNEKA